MMFQVVIIGRNSRFISKVKTLFLIDLHALLKGFFFFFFLVWQLRFCRFSILMSLNFRRMKSKTKSKKTEILGKKTPTENKMKKRMIEKFSAAIKKDIVYE